MPEYLAPGVYVEEVSFRAKSIEGVSTTTTGFVGPARYGPVDIESEIITSLVEYERIYGDRQQLVYDGGAASPNFLWHAARAFFEEGGKRLYVARIFSRLGGNTAPPYSRPGGDIDDDTPDDTDGAFHDGHARAWLTQDPGGGARDNSILARARFPGAAGNRRVRITVTLGQNMLSGIAGGLSAGSLRDHDTVWIGDVESPVSSPVGAGGLYVAHFDRDEKTWIFGQSGTTQANDLRLNRPQGSSAPQLDPAAGHEVRLVSLTVSVSPAEDGLPDVWLRRARLAHRTLQAEPEQPVAGALAANRHPRRFRRHHRSRRARRHHRLRHAHRHERDALRSALRLGLARPRRLEDLDRHGALGRDSARGRQRRPAPRRRRIRRHGRCHHER